MAEVGFAEEGRDCQGQVSTWCCRDLLMWRNAHSWVHCSIRWDFSKYIAVSEGWGIRGAPLLGGPGNMGNVQIK